MLIDTLFKFLEDNEKRYSHIVSRIINYRSIEDIDYLIDKQLTDIDMNKLNKQVAYLTMVDTNNKEYLEKLLEIPGVDLTMYDEWLERLKWLNIKINYSEKYDTFFITYLNNELIGFINDGELNLKNRHVSKLIDIGGRSGDLATKRYINSLIPNIEIEYIKVRHDINRFIADTFENEKENLINIY